MIKERYCSYEVSKLLKEKGFDGDCGDCECHMFYCEYSEERIMPICEIAFVPDNEKVFFAPTHQMAMDWLREKHGIFISIIPQEVAVGVTVLCYGIYRIIDDSYHPVHNGQATTSNDYKDVVEAALEFCLTELI